MLAEERISDPVCAPTVVGWNCTPRKQLKQLPVAVVWKAVGAGLAWP